MNDQADQQLMTVPVHLPLLCAFSYLIRNQVTALHLDDELTIVCRLSGGYRVVAQGINVVCYLNLVLTFPADLHSAWPGISGTRPH